ncbi:MAG: hypothetical protein FJ279_02090 [Planctomycetes bacterium]|nr:hypothetical protein [Planctomycetota bacterium]
MPPPAAMICPRRDCDVVGCPHKGPHARVRECAQGSDCPPCWPVARLDELCRMNADAAGCAEHEEGKGEST